MRGEVSGGAVSGGIKGGQEGEIRGVRVRWVFRGDGRGVREVVSGGNKGGTRGEGRVKSGG